MRNVVASRPPDQCLKATRQCLLLTLSARPMPAEDGLRNDVFVVNADALQAERTGFSGGTSSDDSAKPDYRRGPGLSWNIKSDEVDPLWFPQTPSALEPLKLATPFC